VGAKNLDGRVLPPELAAGGGRIEVEVDWPEAGAAPVEVKARARAGQESAV
jgi:hypothetical protein